MICCRTSLVSWPSGAVGGGRRGAGCGGTGRRGAAMGYEPSERERTGPAGELSRLRSSQPPQPQGPRLLQAHQPIAAAHCPRKRSFHQSSQCTAFSLVTRPKQPSQRLLRIEGCLGNRDTLLILPSPQDTPPRGRRHQSAPCTVSPSQRLARNLISQLPVRTRLGVAMVTTTASICLSLVHFMAPFPLTGPHPLRVPAPLPSLGSWICLGYLRLSQDPGSPQPSTSEFLPQRSASSPLAPHLHTSLPQNFSKICGWAW